MLPYEIEKVEILKKQKDKITSSKREDLLEAGIINLNKPPKITSKDVLNKVKEMLQVEKAGYAGTLDPAVTGVLPIGLGKATKVLQFFSLGGKKYRGTLYLHADVKKEDLEKAFKKFTGKIKQTPPRISAVKRIEREREVYSLKILDIKGRNVSFELSCQHGFYVRKWCHDIGEYLKIGAHMTSLERTQASSFKIQDSVTMEYLENNYKKWLDTRDDKYLESFVLPLEKGVEFLAKIWIQDEVEEHVAHGSPVFVPGIIKLTSNITKGRDVAVFNQKNELIAIGKAEMTSEDIMKKNKGLAIKTDTVLITFLNNN